jgi:glyoxylase-like metal-dependent hydrolase (beta-lactamase superfamily II)
MESRERPTETTDVHRIEIEVDWPPGHVAAYLIVAPEPILIDAGMAGEASAEEFREGITDAGLSVADIEHLVVTHPHVDHIGQVPAVLEAASPTVYAPAGAQERLERDADGLAANVRRNAREVGLKGEFLDTAVKRSVESLERNRELLDPARVDHWIEDGETISPGGIDLEAIHTPGHQADHLCYRTSLGGESLLFAGDIVLEPFRSVVIHTGMDDGVEDGVAAFYRSLDRLDDVDADRVYPGHGPVHERLREMLDRSRGSLDRMLDRAVEQASSGPVTALEVAEARAGERQIHYVLPEVVGALHYLEDQGRLDSSLDDGVRWYTAAESD